MAALLSRAVNGLRFQYWNLLSSVSPELRVIPVSRVDVLGGGALPLCRGASSPHLLEGFCLGWEGALLRGQFLLPTRYPGALVAVFIYVWASALVPCVLHRVRVWSVLADLVAEAWDRGAAVGRGQQVGRTAHHGASPRRLSAFTTSGT